MTTDKSTLFHEEQSFKRSWLAVLLLLGMLIPIGILVSMWIGKQVNSMELLLSLLAVIVVEIPIFLFFIYTRFEIIVLKEGLGYRWWPLQKKYRMILAGEFSEIKTRKSPAYNYGVHWIPGFGWVHNMRGKMGFQIKLISGKKIFLGSERVEELKSTLEKLLNKRIGEFRNEF